MLLTQNSLRNRKVRGSLDKYQECSNVKHFEASKLKRPIALATLINKPETKISYSGLESINELILCI